MDRLEQLTRTLKDRFPGLELRENEPMGRHTTFRIGGPARLMLLPGSAAQAAAALEMLRRAGAQTLIMGNGTNLLIPDGGYAGAGVCMSRPMSELAALDGGRIRAGAGAPPGVDVSGLHARVDPLTARRVEWATVTKVPPAPSDAGEKE